MANRLRAVSLNKLLDFWTVCAMQANKVAISLIGIVGHVGQHLWTLAKRSNRHIHRHGKLHKLVQPHDCALTSQESYHENSN
eukprot:1036725-Amphidinium_carterae.1